MAETLRALSGLPLQPASASNLVLVGFMTHMCRELDRAWSVQPGLRADGARGRNRDAGVAGSGRGGDSRLMTYPSAAAVLSTRTQLAELP